jgi:hypothetical protein
VWCRLSLHVRGLLGDDALTLWLATERTRAPAALQKLSGVPLRAFAATVDWSDRTSSAAVISGRPQNDGVSGSHVYPGGHCPRLVLHRPRVPGCSRGPKGVPISQFSHPEVSSLTGTQTNRRSILITLRIHDNCKVRSVSFDHQQSRCRRKATRAAKGPRMVLSIESGGSIRRAEPRAKSSARGLRLRRDQSRAPDDFLDMLHNLAMTRPADYCGGRTLYSPSFSAG